MQYILVNLFKKEFDQIKILSILLIIEEILFLSK